MQIHCFDIATLEREYTILTNPIVTGSPSSGSIGYGPLAVGPRWVAYSGCPVVVSNCGRVSPQHLTTSASFSGSASNGSLVAHYAKESSKQLAAGIVSLGDIGYKKLSRYCSELLPDSNNLPHSGSPGPGWKANGTVNSYFPDADNVGMVYIVLLQSGFMCYTGTTTFLFLLMCGFFISLSFTLFFLDCMILYDFYFSSYQ